CFAHQAECARIELRFGDGVVQQTRACEQRDEVSGKAIDVVFDAAVWLDLLRGKIRYALREILVFGSEEWEFCDQAVHWWLLKLCFALRDKRLVCFAIIRMLHTDRLRLSFAFERRLEVHVQLAIEHLLRLANRERWSTREPLR